MYIVALARKTVVQAPGGLFAPWPPEGFSAFPSTTHFWVFVKLRAVKGKINRITPLAEVPFEVVTPATTDARARNNTLHTLAPLLYLKGQLLQSIVFFLGGNVTTKQLVPEPLVGL
jgi:hypothetical protein